MTTVDRSGCSVTGHIEVTSSQVNRTLTQPGGAGNVSRCSTGWRTVAPRIVSPSVLGFWSATARGYRHVGGGDPVRTDARPAFAAAGGRLSWCGRAAPAGE